MFVSIPRSESMTCVLLFVSIPHSESMTCVLLFVSIPHSESITCVLFVSIPHSDSCTLNLTGDFSGGVCRVMKMTAAESNVNMGLLTPHEKVKHQ